MNAGSHAKPDSTSDTRSCGKRSNAPSATRLVSCDWNAEAMSTYSSSHEVGHPAAVGGSPGAPPNCSSTTSSFSLAASSSGHQIRLPYGIAERTGR